MIQKKELQIKMEEDGNFKAEKYKIEIQVNILNTTHLFICHRFYPHLVVQNIFVGLLNKNHLIVFHSCDI